MKSLTSEINATHVKWVPCHRGIARPQVTDGGDGLQIWKVAADTSKKPSWTADRDSPPDWGLDRGLTIPHRKKSASYEMLQPRAWTESSERPKPWKIDTRYEK